MNHYGSIGVTEMLVNPSPDKHITVALSPEAAAPLERVIVRDAVPLTFVAMSPSLFGATDVEIEKAFVVVSDETKHETGK